MCIATQSSVSLLQSISTVRVLIFISVTWLWHSTMQLWHSTMQQYHITNVLARRGRVRYFCTKSGYLIYFSCEKDNTTYLKGLLTNYIVRNADIWIYVENDRWLNTNYITIINQYTTIFVCIRCCSFKGWCSKLDCPRSKKQLLDSSRHEYPASRPQFRWVPVSHMYMLTSRERLLATAHVRIAINAQRESTDNAPYYVSKSKIQN